MVRVTNITYKWKFYSKNVPPLFCVRVYGKFFCIEHVCQFSVVRWSPFWLKKKKKMLVCRVRLTTYAIQLRYYRFCYPVTTRRDHCNIHSHHHTVFFVCFEERASIAQHTLKFTILQTLTSLLRLGSGIALRVGILFTNYVCVWRFWYGDLS